MSSPVASPIGKTVGNYVLRSVLGRGGTATVFQADHRFLGDKVAVKILHASTAADPKLVQRFFQEARTTRTLEHPNIVRILDFGQDDEGALYLVMERLEGRSLAAAIASEGKLAELPAVLVGAAVADALTTAHAKGVVHRDLKPANIFLCADGTVKLLDFGIAKAMEESPFSSLPSLVGTPNYMAPEQARQGQVGPHTDTYALGVVLFRLVTGRLPFEADDLATLITRHLNDPPPPPSQLCTITPRLEALILECLEKAPERRPRSMVEVRDRLVSMVEAHHSAAEFDVAATTVEDSSQALAAVLGFTEQEVTDPAPPISNDVLRKLAATPVQAQAPATPTPIIRPVAPPPREPSPRPPATSTGDPGTELVRSPKRARASAESSGGRGLGLAIAIVTLVLVVVGAGTVLYVLRGRAAEATLTATPVDVPTAAPATGGGATSPQNPSTPSESPPPQAAAPTEKTPAEEAEPAEAEHAAPPANAENAAAPSENAPPEEAAILPPPDAPPTTKGARRRPVRHAAPPPAARAQATAPARTLERAEVEECLSRIHDRLLACSLRYHAEGRARLTVMVDGRGAVESAFVDGAFTGTPAAICVTSAARSCHFQPFAGKPQSAQAPFSLP